jgi:hypothetical protein
MHTSLKIVAGLAAAGLAAAGGSAFTATGLATSGTAASAQFVGGTISQAVTGGTLSSIAYGYTNPTNTAVNTITLTFANANADTRAVTAVATGGNNGTFTCENVAATTTMISTCTYGAGADAAAGTTGITSLAVNVASS